MAGTGLIDLLGQDIKWRLTSLDDGHTVKGQYIPTDVRKDVKGKYGMVSTLGRDQPIIQYLSHEADRFSFTARVWAQHDGLFGLLKDDIEDLAEEVENLARVDPDLGRPHIFDFAIGQTDRLSSTVVVESVGGMTFDRLRPLDGDLRGVTFSISLIRFDPYDVSLSGRAAESLVLPFRDNESYELAAQRVYGDPVAGEALRRRNPDIPTPSPATFIHFPPRPALLTGFLLTPQSGALERTDDNEDNRRAHFALRGAAQVSHKLGPLWDGVV